MSALGCAATYQAVIHVQGGARMWSAALPLAECTWSRVLDDASEASIVVPKQDAAARCCDALADTRPWGHELTVYRDGRLVWQGPVRKVIETRTAFTVSAMDVFSWLDRRINPTDFLFAATDLSTIAAQLIGQVLAVHDPGIGAYLQISPCGVIGGREALANQVYVGAEIRDLAAAGLDFTTMGRALWIAGELSDAAPRAVLLAGRDLIGPYELERTGAEITHATVVGEGVSASVGGTDAFLGRIDFLEKAQGTLDQSTAALQAQSLTATYAGPVTVLRLPQTWLSPQAPLSIDELLCGNRIDVTTADMCILPARHAMRLIRVDGSWSDATERIAVSLAPFAAAQSTLLNAPGGV